MPFCPGVPIVLVGCSDPNYRNWRGESLVTLEQVRPCLLHTLQALRFNAPYTLH